MTVINTNTAAINAQYNLSKVQSAMDDAMSALSSGKRITSAADDAAGLSIVTRMESQVRGLNQAMRNAADGQSMVDTAEGAMDEIANMLQRMRELALQAANGTNSQVDRENLNAEVDQLKSEIDRIVGTTTFNDKSLLDGSFGSTLQVGANGGETIAVDIENMSTGALGTITGAITDASAVTSANFAGTEATATVTQMAFNSDADYGFDLTFGTTTAAGAPASVTLSVTNATVDGGSLQQVVDQLNDQVSAAILETPELAGLSSKIKFEAQGNTLTITNLHGGDIDVAGNMGDAGDEIATGTGSITYNSIVGNEDDPGDNLILSSQVANTEFVTGDGSDAVAATADLTLAAASVLDGDVATLTLSVGDDDVVTFTAAGASADDDAATVAALIAAATGEGDNADLYTVTAGDAGALSVSRSDGVNFTAAISAVDASDPAEATDTISADAVTAEDGEEAGASDVSIYLNGSDTYNFTVSVGDVDVDIFDLEYSATAGGLQAFANSVNALLLEGFESGDVTASVANGSVKIENAAGTAITISGFETDGGSTAGVHTSSPGDGDAMEVLDGRDFAQLAGTNGAGAAVETLVTMSFESDLDDGLVAEGGDRYEFTISDGRATAFVDFRFNSLNEAANTLFAAEVNTQLARAGLEGVITASAEAGVLSLTNILGGEIKVADYKSEADGISEIQSGGDTQQGFAKWLDDGDGDAANGKSIAGIDISNLTSATDAVAIIDAALEDIAVQRADLGAISNRLDHTISNLGNIVVNTEAAQSRIEDADFAAETGNLTKAQILSQAATAMLAQANASKQSVLSLLQG